MCPLSIRYYERGSGVEKFIPTGYQVTRDEWNASRGDSFHKIKELKAKLEKRINQALDECGEDLFYHRFRLALEGKKLVQTRHWSRSWTSI